MTHKLCSGVLFLKYLNLVSIKLPCSSLQLKDLDLQLMFAIIITINELKISSVDKVRLLHGHSMESNFFL